MLLALRPKCPSMNLALSKIDLYPSYRPLPASRRTPVVAE
jgi:hypothetical protein